LIGITGTNGKTTTTYLIEGILRAAGIAPAVLGTISYRFEDTVVEASHTTPESTELQAAFRQLADTGAQAFIMEVSSHALEQKRVEGCHFDVGIFSNLTRDHLDYHKTMESYLGSKQQLFSRLLQPDQCKPLRRAAVNMDDEYGQQIAAVSACPVISYGVDYNGDVTAEGVELSVNGITGTLKTPKGAVVFSSHLLGRFNLYNILAAVSAGIAMDLPLEAIKAGIEGHKAVPGRMERVENSHGLTLLVDYAHTGDALENVLKTLKELAKGRIITVFGCGGDRDPGKRSIMGGIAAGMSDLAIVTSDNPRSEDPFVIMAQVKTGIMPLNLREYTVAELSNGFINNGFVMLESRRDAIRLAVRVAVAGDIILLAGKGHEDYQIIGTTKFHFDDREEAAAAFTEIKSLMFTVAEIAAVTGGEIHGADENRVNSVSTDSRTVQPGQLFLALCGESFDGHAFVNQVIAKGIKVLVVSEMSQIENPDRVSVVLVRDTLIALGDLAAAYRRRFELPIVGITGSNGKTTTKEMLAAILEQTGPGLKTAGNLNNLIGLPQMIFKLDELQRWAILEMGMSEPGEIDRLAEIAAPQTGIVLNAFAAHLQSMGDVESVARAKGELLLRLPVGGCAVVNADDALIAVQPVPVGVNRITFGTANADLRATDVESLGINGQRFNLQMAGSSYIVHLQAFGLHNIYNALAAASAANAMGVEQALIVSGLECFRPYDKRFQLESVGGLNLIDDSYNANPASMAAALATMTELKGAKKAYVALGDMLELGSDEIELHRTLGVQAARVADRLYLCGKLTAYTAEGAVSAGMDAASIICTSNHDEIVVDIVAQAQAGDFVLTKGSRGMRMDIVAEGIRSAMR